MTRSLPASLMVGLKPGAWNCLRALQFLVNVSSRALQQRPTSSVYTKVLSRSCKKSRGEERDWTQGPRPCALSCLAPSDDHGVVMTLAAARCPSCLSSPNVPRFSKGDTESSTATINEHRDSASPALGRVGGVLVRLDKPEDHPGHPRIQGLHLLGLLDPPLQGSFSPVARYGPGHYSRFPKDLAGAVRCCLVLYGSHIPAAPLLCFLAIPSGSLLTLSLSRAVRQINRKYLLYAYRRLSRIQMGGCPCGTFTAPRTYGDRGVEDHGQVSSTRT